MRVSSNVFFLLGEREETSTESASPKGLDLLLWAVTRLGDSQIFVVDHQRRLTTYLSECRHVESFGASSREMGEYSNRTIFCARSNRSH